MRKIVSTREGVSLYLDGDEIVIYETGRHMTGQDVANQLNISRSAVCQSLKRSIRRIYYGLKRRNHDVSAIQILCAMANMFNVKTEKEYRKFFRLFPENIKGEIHAAARKKGYCRV